MSKTRTTPTGTNAMTGHTHSSRSALDPGVNVSAMSPPKYRAAHTLKRIRARDMNAIVAALPWRLMGERWERSELREQPFLDEFSDLRKHFCDERILIDLEQVSNCRANGAEA